MPDGVVEAAKLKPPVVAGLVAGVVDVPKEPPAPPKRDGFGASVGVLDAAGCAACPKENPPPPTGVVVPLAGFAPKRPPAGDEDGAEFPPNAPPNMPPVVAGFAPKEKDGVEDVPPAAAAPPNGLADELDVPLVALPKRPPAAGFAAPPKRLPVVLVV